MDSQDLFYQSIISGDQILRIAPRQNSLKIIKAAPKKKSYNASRLFEVEKKFDVQEPRSICKSTPRFVTNFGLISKMIHHQGMINCVKSQNILNKRTENNYSRIREKPRQIITYGNKLVKKKTFNQKNVNSEQDISQLITRSIFDHRSDNNDQLKSYPTYDIKKLDYYLMAKKIESTRLTYGSIFGSNNSAIFEGTLFGHLKSYYQKASQYAKIPVQEIDGHRFLEGRDEIISVLVQSELAKDLMSSLLCKQDIQRERDQLVRICSSINVFVDGHVDICETSHQQVAVLILLDINSTGDDVNITLINTLLNKEEQISCKINQLIVVPPLHKLRFQTMFTGEHCITLVFYWHTLSAAYEKITQAGDSQNCGNQYTRVKCCSSGTITSP